MCSVHTCVDFEKRGIPAVVIITTAFKNVVEVQFKGKGMPGHPAIVLPHPVTPLSREELSSLVREQVDNVVRQLTAGV